MESVKSQGGGGDNHVVTTMIEESVALVTLNRPEARNAINAAMALALERVVRQVEDNPAIRVAILTGAGDRAFCAGADLKEVSQGRLDDTFTPQGGFAGFVNASRAKPWIAAVNGAALAGGFEIVLACDAAISVAEARFGLSEVKRGLIASGGGLYRLPRALPKAIALEMIATGEPIDAGRAAMFGLINHIVERDALLDAATGLARKICAAAPLAVQESLRIARAAARFDDATLRATCDEAQSKLSRTEDFAEGALAFVEKRPPNWRGR